MLSFDSPSRQNSTQNCQPVVQRQGDWICYHCNNLNFSFRKRCNRCKSQTKEQNEQLDSFYKFGIMNLEERVLQDKTNYLDYGEIQQATMQRKSSQNSLSDFKSQILNPQQTSLTQKNICSGLQKGESYSSCSSEKLGWHLFLSSDEEIWDQNSLSESSAENEEYEEQVDEHIQNMVTKLII